MKSDYYVYCYFRPTGEPCYIGKGRGGRYTDHIKGTRNHSNPHLRRIIVKAGGYVPHIKLHVGLTNEQASSYEIALIKAIGREPNGPLVNLTDGGEGTSGRAISERMVSAARAMGLSGKGLKKPHSEETKIKIGNANRGKTCSPAHRAQISATKMGKKRGPHSEETRAKISASQKGKTIPKEQIDRRTKSRQGWKPSLEHRAKISATLRARYSPTSGDGHQAQPSGK